MVVRELINLIGFEINEAQLARVEARFKFIGTEMSKIGRSLSMYITAPLALVGGVALKTSANLESMQIAFETMLGSASAATKLVSDLIAFTARTPFQLPEVRQNSKLLLAYGVSLDRLIPTMGMLGDVAAGLSVPLGTVARAYGQVQTKGRLLGDDLRQFTEAGVPILDYLSQLTGIAKKDLPDAISKSKISAEMVTKAFEMMTGRGGKFNNMMLKQSKSLAGVWSNLQDSTTLLLASVGDAIDKTFNLRENMVKLTAVLLKVSDWFKNAPPFMRSTVIIVATIAAAIGPLIILLGGLATAVGVVAGAMATLSTVSLPLLGTIAGIAAAIIAAILAFVLVYDDIDTWIKGGDSIAGALLGPFKEWSDGVKEIFGGIGKFIEDFFFMVLTGKWEPVVEELKTFLFIVKDVVKSFLVDIDNLFLGGMGGKFLNWLSKIDVPMALADKMYSDGGLQAAGMGGGAVDLSSVYGGKSSKNLNVKSTINLTLPVGTEQQHIDAVKQAAELSVEEIFNKHIRGVIVNNSGEQ